MGRGGPVTVSRPSASRVTMWSRLAASVEDALGSWARGRMPAQALSTSERRTLTVRYSEMASRMKRTSSSWGRGRSVSPVALSAQQGTAHLKSPWPGFSDFVRNPCA